MRAILLGLFAAALFAVSEAFQHWLVKTYASSTVAAERLVLLFPVAYFGCRWLGQPRSLTFSLSVISRLHYARSFAWTLTAVLLLYAFSVSKSQGVAYILFLLHPAWLLLIESLWNSKFSLPGRAIIPLVGVLGAMVVYLSLGLDPEGDTSLFAWGPAASLLAGGTFAVANFLGPLATTKLRHDDLEKQFYASYLSIYLLVFFLAAQWIFFAPRFEMEEKELVLMFSTPSVALALAALTLIGYAANLVLSAAYKEGVGRQAQVAATDAAIIPVAFVIDWTLGNIKLADYLNLRGVALLVLAAFIVWLCLSAQKPKAA